MQSATSQLKKSSKTMSFRLSTRHLSYICRSCLQSRGISTSTRLRDATPTNPETQRLLLPPAPPSETRIFKLASSRKLIAIQGVDAEKFLNGLTTNSVPDSKNIEGLYSAFLTAQGRILYDVFIYPTNHAKTPTLTNGSEDPTFLIDVEASLAPELMRHIRRYKLRSKFSHRLVDDFDVYSVPNSFRLEDDSQPKVGCVDPRAPGMGRRIVVPSDVQSDELLSQTAVDDELAYKLKRYLSGVAEAPSEIISGSGLPQESNMDYMSGVNFRKGCYVGQELTIRTKHTGVVRKRILPVQLYTSENKPPTNQTEPAYDAALGSVLPEVAIGGNIARVNKKGRSAGKFLGSVGNVGLALCRLEIMTGINLGAEGVSFDPEVDEFKVDVLGEGSQEVRLKAFVPEWHTTGIITNEALQ